MSKQETDAIIRTAHINEISLNEKLSDISKQISQTIFLIKIAEMKVMKKIKDGDENPELREEYKKLHTVSTGLVLHTSTISGIENALMTGIPDDIVKEYESGKLTLVDIDHIKAIDSDSELITKLIEEVNQVKKEH